MIIRFFGRNHFGIVRDSEEWRDYVGPLPGDANGDDKVDLEDLNLVRNNFAPVSKELGAVLHYDKVMIGQLLAGTAIAYGTGKLVMGYLADRSDSRKYLAFGMLLTACLNFLFGATTHFSGHLLLSAAGLVPEDAAPLTRPTEPGSIDPMGESGSQTGFLGQDEKAIRAFSSRRAC